MINFQIFRDKARDLSTMSYLCFLEGVIHGLLGKLPEKFALSHPESTAGFNVGKEIVKNYEEQRKTAVPESVAAWLKRNNIKSGTIVTNGKYEWRVTRYVGDGHPNHVYLAPVDRETKIVAGRSLDAVHIHGLRKKPQAIKTYKWVVKFTHVAEPQITEGYYPDEAQVRSVYQTKSAIQWVNRLDKCVKEEIVECDC